MDAPFGSWCEAIFGSGAAHASVEVRSVSTPSGRSQGWRALAVDSLRGRLAIGHERGVLVLPIGAPDAVPVAYSQWQTDVVQDLAFDAERGLWIATRSGLWLAQSDGTLLERSPGLGEASRRVRSIATAGELIVAGTADGAYLALPSAVALDSKGWQPLSRWLPSGTVAAIAIARHASAANEACESGESGESGESVGSDESRASLWVAVDAAVYRVELGLEDARWSVESVVRVTGLPTDATPVALVTGMHAREAIAIYPQQLALVRTSIPAASEKITRCTSQFEALRTRGSHRAVLRAEPSPDAASVDVLRVQIERPVLAPGTAMRDLVRSDEHWWLATDRGLFVSPALVGPWSRHPAAPSPIDALEAGDAVWLISESALHRGDADASSGSWQVVGPSARTDTAVTDSALRARASDDAHEPDVQRVQAVALRHLSLEPERFTRLSRRLEHRAWLPELDLDGGYAHDDTQRRDYDEAFLSGAMRHLRDRDRSSRSDWDVSATLRWDFRDLLYPADAVDLSREVRQVIALRDDVLDEIAQIYYERLALRARVVAADFEDEASRARAELRIAELTAGLDGWTGGWFSAQRRASSTAPACAKQVCGPGSNPEK
jgi:hypothetical protein